MSNAEIFNKEVYLADLSEAEFSEQFDEYLYLLVEGTRRRVRAVSKTSDRGLFELLDSKQLTGLKEPYGIEHGPRFLEEVGKGIKNDPDLLARYKN